MTRRGFTLIELLVVIAIIGTLLTLTLPRYFKSVDRSKETVLRENLYVTRDAIGKYYADKGKYPESLEALATEKYLRKIPVAPITESTTTWVVVPPDDPKFGEIVKFTEWVSDQHPHTFRVEGNEVVVEA